MISFNICFNRSMLKMGFLHEFMTSWYTISTCQTYSSAMCQALHTDNLKWCQGEFTEKRIK